MTPAAPQVLDSASGVHTNPSPERIALWARDIGVQPLARRHVARRPSHLSSRHYRQVLAPQVYGVGSYPHPSAKQHPKAHTQLAESSSSSNGGLHDLLASSSGGAVQGAGPAVPRPPRRLLRRRLRHRQEDQDRQALRCVP